MNSLMRNFIIYIIIIIILYISIKNTSIFNFNQKKNKSTFWIHQPVSRGYIKWGIITNNKPQFTYSKQFKIIFMQRNDLHFLRLFLQSHFLKGYNYSHLFLDNHLSNKLNDNLLLYTNSNKLIGSLCNNNIQLTIHLKDFKKTLDIGYVDFLAVHTNYRKKSIATELIKKIISVKQNDTFIFKIDDTPLPFDHLCEYKYYIIYLKNILYNVNKNQFIHLNKDLYRDAFTFYQKQCKLFSIYQSYSYNHFCNQIEKCNTLVKYNGNKVTCIVQYNIFKFVSNKWIGFFENTQLIAEVCLFLSVSNSIIDNIKDLKYYLSVKSDILLMNTIGINSDYLTKSGFTSIRKGYIQIYNFGIAYPLKSENILLNVL